MTTLFLVIASIVCVAIVILYGGAFIHLFLANKEALIIGAVMALALLVFAALY